MGESKEAGSSRLPFPCIPFNFGGLEEGCGFASSSTAVIPVPLETGPPTVGSSQGPYSIIAASREAELYDMELKCEVHSRGIYTHGELLLDYSSPEAPLETVERCVGLCLDREKYPLLIGGDRTVSLGALKACLDRHERVTMVVLSGRTDLEDRMQTRAVCPLTASRRLVELAPVILAGYRSASAEALAFLGSGADIKAFEAGLLKQGIGGFARGLEGCNGKAYVSVDLNVLDPAFMPFPANPDPGGLDWEEILSVLREVFSRFEVLGCDISGYVPAQGSLLPEQIASRLALKLIGYRFFLKTGPGGGGR